MCSYCRKVWYYLVKFWHKLVSFVDIVDNVTIVDCVHIVEKCDIILSSLDTSWLRWAWLQVVVMALYNKCTFGMSWFGNLLTKLVLVFTISIMFLELTIGYNLKFFFSLWRQKQVTWKCCKKRWQFSLGNKLVSSRSSRILWK